MKKYLLLFGLFLSFYTSYGQTILISNDFTGYDGTPATVAPGWYYSWNDSSSSGVSFYSSAGSCGLSCPSYKFGLDSVTIITPAFSQADSVRFYMKGNGTLKPANHFDIYESSDSTNWNLLVSMDSISIAGLTHTFPVNSASTNLMFFYSKDSTGLNIAFDDVEIFNNTGVGLEEREHDAFSISPNPVSDKLIIKSNLFAGNEFTIKIFDLLGKNVYSSSKVKHDLETSFQLNLNGGIYIVQVESGNKIYRNKILKY